MTDESLRALPRDVPDYHARQAAHLRALAANASTARLIGYWSRRSGMTGSPLRLKSPTEPAPPRRKRNAASPDRSIRVEWDYRHCRVDTP